MRFQLLPFLVISLSTISTPVFALDGGTLRVNPHNGWKAFEVISLGDDPADDGFNWSMLGTFDGLGASLQDASTLRLYVNHEVTDAAISEVDLDLVSFKSAISSMISSGNTAGLSFVRSARQAYDRWSDDGGATWTGTSSISNTDFSRFCSGQFYLKHTFGTNRGFVDDLYITGEETFGNSNYDRLFALNVQNRDFYQLSGVVGSASGGIGGMPRDSWENAALIDTGETDHVALLLSADGGSASMRLFIGEKGKDSNGNASGSFLARNGLAYGSYYLLKDSLPTIEGETSFDGTFDTSPTGALRATKFEDVDTSPSNPTHVVLGNQDFGTFTLDFDLDFSGAGGSFDAAESGFTITMIHDDAGPLINNADNVDWTAPTVLGGTVYEEGLIFVNEDHVNGQVWLNAPDGSDLTLVADTAAPVVGATETSGILDISDLVGYNPGSILLTSNQGTNSSLSVLINPNAALDEADFNDDGRIDGFDYLTWARNFGTGTLHSQGDADNDGDVDAYDLTVFWEQYGELPPSSVALTVPEPSAFSSLCVLLGMMFCRRQKKEPRRGWHLDSLL